MSNNNNNNKKKGDNSGYFRDFVSLCEEITEEPKHTMKTEILKNFLQDFEGDWYLLFKLLLPKQDHRVFQLKDKALIKVMSCVLGTDHDQMSKHLEKGDASETCKKFLMESGSDSRKSVVTLKQVDNFLERLTTVRKQVDQVAVFESFVLDRLTGKDIKYIARLIDKDLKLYAGIRYLLPALHPDAYDAFILTNNLEDIVNCVVKGDNLNSMTQSQSLNTSGIDIAKILAESDSDDDGNDKEREKLNKANNNKDKQKKPVQQKLKLVTSDDSDDEPPKLSKQKEKKKMRDVDNNDDDSDIDFEVGDLKAVNPDDDEDEMEVGSKKRKKKVQGGGATKKQKLIPKMKLFQPIKPMLARASKSFEDSIMRCPNGFLCELKYDGERIQIHWSRSKKKLSCFSRNLKPVMEYKVKEVEPYISQAIKSSVNDVILDGEILLIDTKTGEPLPFGTLGKHKKKRFTSANVCIFMFDILYYEGKSLLEVPLNQRRALMLKTVKPVKDRIMIGEVTVCNGAKSDREAILAAKMQAVIQAGQEGLVLKDLLSIYEPNARHWLKIKKDYLKGMADSADLLVLGAYYGTGSKGGLMSVFLMGVFDEKSKTYKTVCKCGNGHDDETINQLNDDLKDNMVKISGDYSRVPDWLRIDKSLVPDFVVKNPKKTPVWEISGAEFSVTEKHTANISIRFPRVTKIRDDKDPDQATTLKELLALVKASSKKDPVALEESIKIANKATTSKSKKIASIDSDSDDDDDNDDQPRQKQKGKAKASTSKQYDDDDSDEDGDDEDDDIEPAEIKYMWGDISKLTGSDDKLIVHSVDNSGRWSKKGSMGLISDTYGKDAYNMYKNCKTIEMGSIQASEVFRHGDATDKLYVCNLVAQEFIKQGEAPVIDYKQLEVGLHRVRLYIRKEMKDNRRKLITVHFSRLHHAIPNLKWDKCERLLQSCLADKGIPVIVYTKDRDDKARCDSSTKQNPAKKVDNIPKITTVVSSTEQQTIKSVAMTNSDDMDIGSDDGDDENEVSTKDVKRLFASVSAVISGYDQETTDKLASLITSNGGQIQSTWSYFGSGKSTHLITETKDETFDHVSKLDGIIVNKRWIHDCVESLKLIEVTKYLFSGKVVKPDDDATQIDLDITQFLDAETTDIDAEAAKTSASVRDGGESQKLLDIFTGCTVMLFGDVQKRRVVKRYLVAYNADVVEDFDEDLVTHIITDNTSWTTALQKFKKTGNVHIVKSSWVWQSVNEEKRARERSHYMQA